MLDPQDIHFRNRSLVGTCPLFRLSFLVGTHHDPTTVTSAEPGNARWCMATNRQSWPQKYRQQLRNMMILMCVFIETNGTDHNIQYIAGIAVSGAIRRQVLQGGWYHEPSGQVPSKVPPWHAPCISCSQSNPGSSRPAGSDTAKMPGSSPGRSNPGEDPGPRGFTGNPNPKRNQAPWKSPYKIIHCKCWRRVEQNLGCRIPSQRPGDFRHLCRLLWPAVTTALKPPWGSIGAQAVLGAEALEIPAWGANAPTPPLAFLRQLVTWVWDGYLATLSTPKWLAGGCSLRRIKID